jgi:nucleoid-associated protein YgaU
MAPPPGGDTMAPPPGDDSTMAPPPDDTQDKEAPKPHHHHEHAGKVNSYTVHSGDSLWRISGKNKVYGDPFQWPMIFIANRDKIKDPDIIKPDTDLTITRGSSADEVSTAVKKAKDTPRFEPHTMEREKLPIDY